MRLAGLLKTGEILKGSYEILETAGEGACGVVYLAKDLAHPEVRWAVKEVLSPLMGTEEEREAVDRFRKECETLQRLNHPGLPKVIASFSEGHGHYLVMEFVEGQSLQAMLNDHPAPYSLEELKPWIFQLLGILDYLHGQAPPVVFRDLKPSNVMITSGGRAKLIDFGIARHFSPGKEKDTYVMGTPGFSAPEQYGSRQTDPRADIYSLGATLFYLLTKEYPDQFAFSFPPVTRFNADVPGWFSEILARCLEAEPSRRFSTCRELKETLEERFSGIPTAARWTPARQPLSQFTVPAQPPVASGPTMESAVKLFFQALALFAGSLVLTCALQMFAFIFALAGWLLFFVVLYRCLQVFTRAARARNISEIAGASMLGLVTMVLISSPFMFFMPGFLRSQQSGRITACKSNLKNIGTALEMYSTDNGGKYPTELSRLTPSYFKAIPTCSGAGKDTYSPSYRYGAFPDAYTVFCGGAHHRAIGVPPEYPQYNSTQGLIER